MKIHHIGYFVNDIEKAREDFKKIGYVEKSRCIFDEIRKIFIQFMRFGETGGGTIIEMISPGEGCKLFSEKFRAQGSRPYHICYECENLEEKIRELQSENFLLIREPQPAPAIGNRRVAFMYGENVGQIELLELKTGGKEF